MHPLSIYYLHSSKKWNTLERPKSSPDDYVQALQITYNDGPAVERLRVELLADGVLVGLAHAVGHVDDVGPVVAVTGVLHSEAHLGVHLALTLLHI